MAGEPNPFEDPDVAGYLDEKADRIAELEAALKLIASGMKGDRFLADWELSDIANKALTPKRDK